MVNLENHKGSFCVFIDKFCQEGYCSGCVIYLNRSSPTKLVKRRVNMKSQEVVATNRLQVFLRQADQDSTCSESSIVVLIFTTVYDSWTWDRYRTFAVSE